MVATCLVAGLALALPFVSWAMHGAPAVRGDIDPVGGAANLVDVGAAVSVGIDSRTAASSARVIKVLSAGRLVTGAEVFMVKARPDTTRQDRISVGQTQNGLLHVQQPTLEGWDYAVACHLSAYGCIDIRQVPEGVDIVIEMPNGYDLTVSVQDTGGQPLAGARVLVSEHALTDIPAFRGIGAGDWRLLPAGPYSGTFGGLTDSRGEFRLSGLPAGVYSTEVRSDGYIPQPAWDGGVTTLPPATVCRVTLMPVFAAVVEVDGDEVLERRVARTVGGVAAGFTMPFLQEVEEQLMEKHSNAIVIVGASTNATDSVVASLELCARTVGWLKYSVPLKPLSGELVAQRINLLRGSEDLSAVVTVRVFDQGGQEMDGLMVTLADPSSPVVGGNRFGLLAGVEERVLRGTYNAFVEDPFISGRSVVPMAIVYGENSRRLDVPDRWRLVDVAVTRRGERVLRGVVHMDTRRGRRVVHLGPGKSRVWVPIGVAKLTVWGVSQTEVTREVEIEAGESAQVVSLELGQ